MMRYAAHDAEQVRLANAKSYFARPTIIPRGRNSPAAGGARLPGGSAWRATSSSRLGRAVRQPESADRQAADGRTRSDRTIGYDFNFHVPKSVSLLYAMTQRRTAAGCLPRRGRWHDADMEAEMATRVRKGRKNENRLTRNMVWGEYIHFTARPIEGVPDPHLHAHCFVFSTHDDDEEKAGRAASFGASSGTHRISRRCSIREFAGRLADLGLPVERTRRAGNWPASTPD